MYNVLPTAPNKTWQLKQDSRSKCSKCPQRAFTQARSVGLKLRTKQFCGNKTSTGCYQFWVICLRVRLHVCVSVYFNYFFFLSLTFLLLTIFLRHGSVGTHIRGSRQYTCQTARNLFSCYCAKTYRNTSTFYKVIEKKVCSFFETAYCCREWRRYKSVQYKSISTIVNADILV